MALDSAKLRSTIEAITDLPTLPPVVARISSQIANPSTNAADIGKLIEQDQSLTSKVLRLVNSAYYGFPKQIKSIQHAVVILGFNKVKTIIITASVFGAFKRDKTAGLDLSRYWQHSLAVAVASKTTAELIGVGHSAEEAFIGGLLHDIGKVVMDQFQPAVYRPVIKHAHEKGILLLEAEKEIMGVTHAKIGEWMMEKWRLPSIIVGMVAGHHSPERSSERRELVNAVHIGDILARSIGVGNGGDERIPAFDQSVVSNHGIDAKFLDKALTRIIVELGKTADFFALIAGKG